MSPMTDIHAPNLIPEPLNEIIIGVSFLVLIIFVHGYGLRKLNRVYSKWWHRVTQDPSALKADLLLAFAISALTILHLFETMILAVPIYMSGLIPNLRNSYYFVLESYTTLGEGNISLPYDWRLVGPIIAISGLFTFGWTGSVLVNVMSDLMRLDKDRSRKEQNDSR